MFEWNVIEPSNNSIEQSRHNLQQRRARAVFFRGVPFRSVEGGERAHLLQDRLTIASVELRWFSYRSCQLRLLLEIKRENKIEAVIRGPHFILDVDQQLSNFAVLRLGVHSDH